MKVRLLLLLLFIPLVLNAVKIKDISNIIGVRENQLMGYGLVVGLNKTGDGTTSKFTLQTVANMLQTMNVKLDPKDIKSKNVAAVIVTATLPPFARQGDKLDVVVSSIGDAKSLEGGTLLMTPLKGVDGRIYALAQGSVTIGGRNGKGGGTLNHATAGKIPAGALVEQEVPFNIYNQTRATLSLKEANFKNAVAIQDILNRYYKEKIAVAVDSRTIRLKKPQNMSMVEFLANIGELSIDYETKSKIVIDERTGTIIAGVDIEIKPVIISHGDITIEIKAVDSIPQLTAQDVKNGTKVNVGEDMQVQLDSNRIINKRPPNTVASMARALKRLNVTPKDLISILEAMKQAGAIQADLEII